MSDLRERFNNSPELHAPSPEAVELERDRQRAKEEPTEREKFLAKHPEFSDLQRSEVTSSNKMALLEKVKAFSMESLKAELSSRENDLTESERAFAAEVLGLRVSRVGSVRQLLDDLHIDSAEDFNRAVVDARDIRRARERHEGLKSRYPSMPDFAISPESHVIRPL